MLASLTDRWLLLVLAVTVSVAAPKHRNTDAAISEQPRAATDHRSRRMLQPPARDGQCADTLGRGGRLRCVPAGAARCPSRCRSRNRNRPDGARHRRASHSGMRPHDGRGRRLLPTCAQTEIEPAPHLQGRDGPARSGAVRCATRFCPGLVAGCYVVLIGIGLHLSSAAGTIVAHSRVGLVAETSAVNALLRSIGNALGAQACTISMTAVEDSGAVLGRPHSLTYVLPASFALAGMVMCRRWAMRATVRTNTTSSSGRTSGALSGLRHAPYATTHPARESRAACPAPSAT